MRTTQAIIICLLLSILLGISALVQYQQNGLSAMIDEQGRANYLALPKIIAEKNSPSDLDETSQLKYQADHQFSFVVLPLYYFSKAMLVDGEKAKGISSAEVLLLFLFNWIILAIGLFFLLKLLLIRYSATTSIIGIILTVFASNLYIYSTSLVGYQEVLLFSLLSIFIYQAWKAKNPWIGALTFALILFLEPAHLFLVLLLFMQPIGENNDSVWDRVRLRKFGFTLLLSYLVLMTLYYSMVPEEVWSPEESAYFWLQPRFYRALLEYRKGWLIYSPIMIFAIIGLIRFFRKKRKAYFFLIYFISLLYFLFSYWNWWYSDSFGQRVMIPLYPIMAIGLAEIANVYLKTWKPRVQFWMAVLVAFLLLLNIFQSEQYHRGVLSKDGMTERLYWASFGEDESISFFDCLEKKPNYSLALKEGSTASYDACEGENRLYLNWLVRDFKDGTPIDTFGVIRFQAEDAPVVYYKSLQRWTRINISLDSDDDYALRFIRDGELIHVDRLISKDWADPGLYNHAYLLDPKVKDGFDKLELEVLRSETICAIGSLRFY